VSWIVPRLRRLHTLHRYSSDDDRVRPVELAVVHWTATPHTGGPSGADEPRMRRWLHGQSERQTSTHLVALRDGGLLQGATLDERCWHAGGSKWQGEGHVNHRSIGFDLENVGYLSEGSGRFVDAYGGKYKGPTPIQHQAVWHEPYTVAQLVAFLWAAGEVVALLPILEDPERWVGHRQIRATKRDPGPFPWGALREVLGGESPGLIDWDKYEVAP